MPRVHNGVVAALAVALTLLALAFAGWGEVPRRASAHGVLLPSGGLINVTSSIDGQLTELLVAEGQAIAKGQVMARVKVPRHGVLGDAAVLNARAIEQRRLALQQERRLAQEQAQMRARALRDRIQLLTLESAKADREHQSALRHSGLAAAAVQRYQDLLASGYVAEAVLQQKQAEQIDSEIRADSTHRSQQAIERETRNTAAELDELQVSSRTVVSQIDRQLSALDQEAVESSARSELSVRAPATGRVGAISVRPGQTTQAGQTIAALVPIDAEQSHLVARLYVPSRDVGLTQIGQVVWLRYAAFPYQKFGMAKATVSHVSHAPTAPADLPTGQAQALSMAAKTAEPLFEIQVTLQQQFVTAFGNNIPLRAGMALDADIIQEQRKVWEWLLEPLLAARQRLSPGPGFQKGSQP